MKFIHMPDTYYEIYDFRTTVERVNARLTDEFGARFLRILALTADQMLRVISFRPLASLRRGRPATQDHQKLLAISEFCKRLNGDGYTK